MKKFLFLFVAVIICCGCEDESNLSNINIYNGTNGYIDVHMKLMHRYIRRVYDLRITPNSVAGRRVRAGTYFIYVTKDDGSELFFEETAKPYGESVNLKIY